MKDKLKKAGIFVIVAIVNILLNCCKGLPLSLSFYAALAFGNYSVVASTAAFLISFVAYPKINMILSGCAMAAVIGSIAAVYKKRKKVAGAEISLYIFCASAVYVVIGDGKIYAKLVYTAIIALFTIVSKETLQTFESGEIADEKGVGRCFCLAAFFSVCGIGLLSLAGEDLYKGVAVFLILCVTRLRGGSYAFAGVLSVPLAVTDPKYTAVFLCYAAGAAAFMRFSHIIASLMPVTIELALTFLLGFYDSFGYVQGISIFCGGMIFALIPSSLYKSILATSPKTVEDTLTKDAINKTRTELSTKLYDLSGVFSGLENSLSSLSKEKKSDMTAQKIALAAAKKCRNCVAFQRCLKCGYPDENELTKIVEVGIAKGRITLVDLTRDFLDVCGYPNGMIFEINKLIAERLDEIRANERTEEVNGILRLFSKGVGDGLKDKAFALSSVCAFKGGERKIAKKMAVLGTPVKGLLVTGENEEKRLSVFADKKYDGIKLAASASQAIDERLTLSTVTPVDEKTAIFSFTPALDFDAVFGVGSVTKFASEACGDAHSVIKISESKFLVSLSDGMGSGTKAYDTTDATLSLVEGLYRAGISSETALPLINKILSVSTEDNFAAVDIAVVDLKNGSCNFIKIGAPYGFVVSPDGLKFIEGSSLPLGILDELKPTTATTTLADGDMILMLSDGVTDAFSSSSELVEFLKTAPQYNPQALCDGIINRALELDDGKAKDDMTAVCVRIFKPCPTAQLTAAA